MRHLLPQVAHVLVLDFNYIHNPKNKQKVNTK